MHLIILPNQLFDTSFWPRGVKKVSIVEHPRYFSDFKFHKHKLILHRATMKNYFEEIKSRGLLVEYIDFADWDEFKGKINSDFAMFDPVDHKTKAELSALGVHFFDTPMFLTKKTDFEDFFKGKKRLFMQQFYIWQRRRLNILLEESGEPVGGKWSFDTENRKSIKKLVNIPLDPTPVVDSSLVSEAKKYVTRHFDDNPGSNDSFWYQLTRKGAKKELDKFLSERLGKFGDYEDAISETHSVLYHSVLTPYLNIGLLTPDFVLERTLEYAKDNDIPLNSLEGFIRQIIGWREFVRAVYELLPNLSDENYFKHKGKINENYYQDIGVTPFDTVFKRLIDKSYTHHIERLMVFGSFFLMTEKDPKEVYRWFMELFIDSYDWVMVPNVFGMSQFADGGGMVTKPYLSGSSYILKMSDFKKGNWADLWDGLFWRFIGKHKELFSKNPRSSVLVKLLEKNINSIIPKIKKAEEFFKL